MTKLYRMKEKKKKVEIRMHKQNRIHWLELLFYPRTNINQNRIVLSLNFEWTSVNNGFFLKKLSKQTVFWEHILSINGYDSHKQALWCGTHSCGQQLLQSVLHNHLFLFDYFTAWDTIRQVAFLLCRNCRSLFWQFRSVARLRVSVKLRERWVKRGKIRR